MINIPIPDIPPDLSVEMSDFLTSVKELLETLNGQRDPDGAVYTSSTLSSSDLLSTGGISSPFTNYGSIKPPTDFVITVKAWSHSLEWVNATGLTLDGVEIWAYTDDDVTASSRIAIVGRKTTKFERFGFDTTLDWYYWIRSISYTGKYSTWVPTTLQGGYLVPKADSLGERIHAVIDALKGHDPATYSAATAYDEGELVSWTDGDGNKKRYERTDYSPGSSGKAPSLSAYWDRAGILMEGDVDGVATVGIDGNLVVDQTILARSIVTAGLTVGDGTGSTIQIADGVITVDKFDPTAAAVVLNENTTWAEISGTGKPASNATQNLVYCQSGTPTGSAGAIWIDTGTDPPVEKHWISGAWTIAASNDVSWRHGSNSTRIDGGKIFTGSIVADAIAANTITANKLGVSQLSAITADCGTLTAGKIQSTDGKFIVQLGTTGYMLIKDALGVERVRLGYISG